MEFQNLRLTGFKSFVEPTDFEIRPGLTGIVGPNGCGKSNLLEAMRWVMGATSAKALRAGGMEDVIFQGTKMGDRPGRPARSWAEVCLQINNEDRSAPAEYNDHPMLEISRRITKKAEGASSTYRINGKEVRAKDVQLLFADAATGANSPALVRQGQVSDLINAKPENRRKFLEEAAGVTGLYQRRHEAELRLRAASTNLERLDDVTSELDAQRGVLSRQARQATRYRNIAGHLKRAEALLAYSRWKEADDAITQANDALKEALNDFETAVRAAASANAEREKQHDFVEPLRQKEAEAAAGLHRLQIEQDNFDKEVDRAHADIEQLTAKKEQLERELAREKDLGSDAANALLALNQEEVGLTQRQGAEVANLQAADAAVRAGQEALSSAESDAENHQHTLAVAEAEHRALKAAHEKISRTASTLGHDHQRATQEKANFDAQGSLGTEIAALQEDLFTQTKDVEQAKSEAEQASHARQEAVTKADALQAPRDDAAAKVNASQAEVDTLRRILAETDTGDRAIVDDITVTEGYEAALAAALDDGLAVGNDPEADRFWSPLGADTFTASPLPEGASALSAHVNAPDILSRRLAHIGVIDPELGPQAAKSLRPGQRLVSCDGDLWRWDGFVAKAGAKTAAAIRLAQKRQLAEREASLDDAFSVRDIAEHTLGEAKVGLAQFTQSENDARRSADEHQKAALTTERKIAALAHKEQHRSAQADRLKTRLDDIAARRTTATLEAEEASKKISALSDLSVLQAALNTARRTRDEARNVNGRARGKRADLQRDRDARQARLAQITEQREGWSRRKQTATERTKSVLENHAETLLILEKAQCVPGQLEERRDSIAETLANAESRRRFAADELEKVQSALTDAGRTARQADEAVSLSREVKARAEAQTEAATERLTDVRTRAHEVHDGDLASLLELAEHKPEATIPSQDDLDTKIEKLKREREALGGVNLCADQEMQDIDARLEEITTEREDCESAIAKLRGAIGSLNRDGRQRLLSAFDTVNANFKELFTQLFGGGSAELCLVNSDDPLESGLEIYASPPGKKLSSMSLMSGGEQALTATALIFAVFKSNPAPVCVLDEVDAPLDDANTERFCQMLHNMALETKTRFIAITHHPLTMSRMDRLYGVTMVERGVSQLVSVDLKEAEKIAA